jgi:hypothetical protein
VGGALGARHLPNCGHSRSFFNGNPNDALVKIEPLSSYS